MSISGTLSDLELQKFVESETRPGQAAVEIVGTINAVSSNPANGDVDDTVPTVATLIGGSDGTDLRAIKVNASGEIVLAPGASGLTDTELRASPVPVTGSFSVTGVATEVTLADLNSKVTAVNTGAVVVASSALPSGAATSALQTQPGVDIGDVTINNASGAAAVNIQDGGNSITVDGTFWQATQPVSAATLPLPTGAATSANQITEIASLANLDVALSTRLKPADTLAAVTSITNVVHVDDNAGSLTIDNANLDVALSTRLKPADTLAAVTNVTTVGTITNVVHVDDNSGSLTIDNANLDVALSTRLKPADTLAAVTTVGTITNVVHVDDNSGSLTIDNANLDVALSTRLKPADTLAAVTTVGTITNVVHVDDNAGSITIDNANLDVALSTRLKPADTLAAVTTVGTITNVVHVDDNTGSLTIDNANLVSIDAKMNSLGQKTMANSMPVTLASDQTNLPNNVLATATASWASGSGAQTLVLSCAGIGTAKIFITGTFTGTIVFECSYDGSSWQILQGANVILLDGQIYLNFSNAGSAANAIYSFPVGGYHSIRARTAGITVSGPAVVTINGSVGSNMIEAVLATTFVSGTVTATIASGATTIAKAEDLASANAHVGVPAMAVRKATPANTSDADGDYEFLNMANGRLWTSTVVDTALPAGTALIGKVGIDQTTPGTTNLVSIGTNGTVAIGTALPAGTALIGKVGIDQTTPGTTNKVSIGTDGTVAITNLDVALSTRLKPADTLTGVTTVGTVTSVTNPVTVTPPTITKGTQAATGFSVQDLKDAGRNQTNFFMALQIVSTNTDTLMSLTGYKSGAAVGATTTPAVVTSGKTYRINSVTIQYTTIVTTPGSVRFSLRANTGGVAAIGSPLVCTWEVGEPTGIAPVAGKVNTVHLTFPDGIEFAAGTGIGISMIGLNTVGTAAAVGYGRITIHGYEY